MVLAYTKNKEVHVFEGENRTREVRAGMVDMCFEGEMRIKTSKTMEILEIDGTIIKSFHEKCSESLKTIERLKGRRIAGGFTKMVWGVVGKKIYGTLDDNLYSMQIDIRLKLPELVIDSLTGKMRRFTTPFCEDSVRFLEKGKGIKIEPGFQSKVKRLIGRPGCRHFGNLINECCESIIPGLVCMKFKEKREDKPDVFRLPSKIGGYNATFVDLGVPIQNEIIDRLENLF